MKYHERSFYGLWSSWLFRLWFLKKLLCLCAYLGNMKNEVLWIVDYRSPSN
jgi:hypothetical protein